MQERIKAYLLKHPGITSFQISAGMGLAERRSEVRAVLKSMISRGEVSKSGRGKGTYYTYTGLPSQDQREAPSDVAQIPTRSDALDKILSVLISGGRAGRVTSEIVLLIDSDASQVRAGLKSLIALGDAVKTGRKRGTRYFAAKYAPAADSVAPKATSPRISQPKARSPKVRAQKAPPKQAPQLPAPQPKTEKVQIEALVPTVESAPTHQVSVREAIELTIQKLRAGKLTTPQNISRQAAEKYGVSHLRASECVYDMVRQEHPSLYAQFRYVDGYRLMVWKPKPGEERPERRPSNNSAN